MGLPTLPAPMTGVQRHPRGPTLLHVDTKRAGTRPRTNDNAHPARIAKPPLCAASRMHDLVAGTHYVPARPLLLALDTGLAPPTGLVLGYSTLGPLIPMQRRKHETTPTTPVCTSGTAVLLGHSRAVADRSDWYRPAARRPSGARFRSCSRSVVCPLTCLRSWVSPMRALYRGMRRRSRAALSAPHAVPDGSRSLGCPDP